MSTWATGTGRSLAVKESLENSVEKVVVVGNPYIKEFDGLNTSKATVHLVAYDDFGHYKMDLDKMELTDM